MQNYKETFEFYFFKLALDLEKGKLDDIFLLKCF